MFGNKLEALDALRMQDKVFISLLQATRTGQWQVQIAGYEIIDVEVAKEHFGTMIKRVRADASSLQHTHSIIIDEREGINVELQQDEPWWPNHADRVVPRLLPSGLMDEPGSFRQEGLHFTQLSSVQNSIRLALDNVRHRKGSYDFVVRLGCLALSSKHVTDDKIGQTFTKKEFLKDVNGPIELDVKKW